MKPNHGAGRHRSFRSVVALMPTHAALPHRAEPLRSFRAVPSDTARSPAAVQAPATPLPDPPPAPPLKPPRAVTCSQRGHGPAPPALVSTGRNPSRLPGRGGHRRPSRSHPPRRLSWASSRRRPRTRRPVTGPSPARGGRTPATVQRHRVPLAAPVPVCLAPTGCSLSRPENTGASGHTHCPGPPLGLSAILCPGGGGGTSLRTASASPHPCPSGALRASPSPRPSFSADQPSSGMASPRPPGPNAGPRLPAARGDGSHGASSPCHAPSSMPGSALSAPSLGHPGAFPLGVRWASWT